MEKKKQKTNLRLAYDKLNNEEKQNLIKEYNSLYQHSSFKRFYEVIRVPQKLTASEGRFFSQRLRLSMAKVIGEDSVDNSQLSIATSLKLSK